MPIAKRYRLGADMCGGFEEPDKISHFSYIVREAERIMNTYNDSQMSRKMNARRLEIQNTMAQRAKMEAQLNIHPNAQYEAMLYQEQIRTCSLPPVIRMEDIHGLRPPYDRILIEELRRRGYVASPDVDGYVSPSHYKNPYAGRFLNECVEKKAKSSKFDKPHPLDEPTDNTVLAELRKKNRVWLNSAFEYGRPCE